MRADEAGSAGDEVEAHAGGMLALDEHATVTPEGRIEIGAAGPWAEFRYAAGGRTLADGGGARKTQARQPFEGPAGLRHREELGSPAQLFGCGAPSPTGGNTERPFLFFLDGAGDLETTAHE